MKLGKPWFENVLNCFRHRACSVPDVEYEKTPLRAEVFSADQMARHGARLAKSHKLTPPNSHDRLLVRLSENESVLIDTCGLLTEATKAGSRIAPAGEWLLDNFYLVEDQISIIRQHLPKNYSLELPRLAEGPSAKLPRVYDLALEVISHSDGRIDADILSRFVAAYQTVTNLTLGELWAIPIMLRLALIENLRRVSARITQSRNHVNQAQAWAEKMLHTAEDDPKSLIMVIADMARAEPPMASAFIAELSRQLQGHGSALALPLTWIEQRLTESNSTIEQMVLAENQQQANDQVSISNSIVSLRALGAIDWRVFVESMSIVEKTLRKDPAKVYPAMDFSTRDDYRGVVERLTRSSPLSEADVAQAVLDLAQENAGEGSRAAHVGFYLVDHGLELLEQRIAARLSTGERAARLLRRRPLWAYAGAMLALALILSAVLIVQLQTVVGAGWLLLLAIVVFVATFHLSSALINWIWTLVVQPRRLPRLDFSKGIPSEFSAVIAVPSLLSNARNVEQLLESLEVRFLGNQDENLHYALLTDFCDAAVETTEADKDLLDMAIAGIEHLNKKYPRPITAGRKDPVFLLLHRNRTWNPVAGIWMGYERKRGKLDALNAVIRGQDNTCFTRIVGDADALIGVRYVITLDTDTQLPRDSARELVGTMAHLLNRPRYDTEAGRVVSGYGILQPRMAASLSGAERSRYARLYGSEPGLDPYTQSVSDVYQDFFGEGSFIGKGIYDVEAFVEVLGQRLPENRILSHDLLEGCYARSGLVSDVQLYEEYPARYQDDVNRRERWIRGDWQIARWLLPRVPDASGRKVANPLSALSRWKIFDNLLRSLAAPALMVLLVAGWLVMPQVLTWTLSVLAVIYLPALLIPCVELLRKSKDMSFGRHLEKFARSGLHNLARAGFRLAGLPHEAAYHAIAIVRAIWRLWFARGRLLDWRSSGESNEKSASLMWSAPLIALFVASAVLVVNAGVLIFVAPVLLLWLVFPAVAIWISRSLVHREVVLSIEQKRFLRKLSRKTWAFFERFVGPEDNWLPPDNFQEQPGPRIAHRTSPTNMGLSLLANLSAFDFGYISAGTLVHRTAMAFGTMEGLERYQGHFYNWYDTRSLQTLPPRYVSSVDSGNLAGHLLTLRSGILELADQPLISVCVMNGLLDTLDVLADELDKSPDTGPGTRETIIQPLRDWLAEITEQSFSNLSQLSNTLELAVSRTREAADNIAAGPGTEVAHWIDALVRQCQDIRQDLLWLAPWLALPSLPIDCREFPSLDSICSLPELLASIEVLVKALDQRLAQGDTTDEEERLSRLREALESARERAGDRLLNYEELVGQATELATMEYEFLYDRTRHLLAVGYNADDFRKDTCFYDLLASEARLTNFVAIAQGKIPQESWFALGRLRTNLGGDPVLVSWSGSMFEYLMPILVMPLYRNSLLEHTCRVAVARQIAYGNQRAVPWGISESGYNTFDAALNYQYHAFGVPGLGFKRGLAEDLVISPYASALALMVEPEAACANLQRLARRGLEGRYGLYEAVDCTPSRLVRGESSVVVRSFMVHHQGMSLLSLAYLLLGRPMQRRFEADPLFQSTLLLLQERIPKSSVFHTHVAEQAEGGAFFDSTSVAANVPMPADTPAPQVQLLSNGRYHVMLTNAGGGYSRWKDLAVTRWREDSTCDNWGTFVYVRDIDSGEYWSAAYQPTLRKAESYEAMFTEGRAEYRRRDHDIQTYTEIVVSPEDDIELRRLCITNRSRVTRTVEITSYGEVVIARQAADINQTAFGNLFVQTEILADHRAILCTRRPRAADEMVPWMFHLLAASGCRAERFSCETDRMRFLGRGRTIVAPQAMEMDGDLSGSDGSVLDPMVGIRFRVKILPGEMASFDLVTGAAESRAECMMLIEKYQDRHLADRAFDLAATHSGVILRQINASQAEAQLYRRLAGPVLYAKALLRADASLLLQNRRGQSGLWGYGISGDLPIVLLKISDSAHIELARQLVQCHAYWRLKGLTVDLVILNEDHVGYRQHLQDLIMGLIITGSEAHTVDRPGGIFVRSGEPISREDRVLLQTVARVVFDDKQGSLADQINRRPLVERRMTRISNVATRAGTGAAVRSRRAQQQHLQATARSDLILNNPLGGFTEDGREYIITTTAAHMTPAPWVNVLANSGFGTVVSESGLAYSWSENAHEFRLSPWSDDAVGATGGEAYYLRDEESGSFWSPTLLPAPGSGTYVTRHGFGYSVFEHSENGIQTELWVYVDREHPIKYSVLKVRNQSGRRRQLSATGYVEWVLGDLRSRTAMHIVTELEGGSGALLARNAYNTEFPGRVAFFDTDERDRSVSGDRAAFIGRNGTLAWPDAMTRVRLPGRLGAALDPCAVIQVPFELADGQEREIIFRLGAGENIDQARALIQKTRQRSAAHDALDELHRDWNRTLGAVQIETPDVALNVLINGWLMYQTLACRIWARSGFYQSGGAYGFRDQLQDVMALVHTRPDLVRAHILHAAQRQYPEGDVQHWWHPPTGRGVRTRCSDDYLWLPLVTCHYARSTGDMGIFDEHVYFLAGRSLEPDEESYYDLPGNSTESASLYQHCVRAIGHGLRMGEHGLPLMGSGDWNDGMDRVGIHGKGESVWLGFMLYKVLMDFSSVAKLKEDPEFSQRCRLEAERLRKNIERHAWDGGWYRRAYFDDGAALGTVTNAECSIDSIAQSWSVLSGAGDPERVRLAMDSMDRHLVRREKGIIQLLDPPFDTSPMNPGYIKGYVPGVRENGGQYTHAAVWATMAFAALGDNRRAWELLNIINPINHARNAESVAIYKVEPYVVAADVYAIEPHTGRGGWTWYTGSAGLLYRLVVESLLGIRREADVLYMTPCLPERWRGYSLRYRYGETVYQISVEQQTDQSGMKKNIVMHNGIECSDGYITLVDDRSEHTVLLRIVEAEEAPRMNVMDGG